MQLMQSKSYHNNVRSGYIELQYIFDTVLDHSCVNNSTQLLVQASTLVGLNWENPVLDILAVQHLNNQLYMCKVHVQLLLAFMYVHWQMLQRWYVCTYRNSLTYLTYPISKPVNESLLSSWFTFSDPDSDI